jgi:hypothetical protein
MISSKARTTLLVFVGVLVAIASLPASTFAAPGDLLLTFHDPIQSADNIFGWSVAGVGSNVLVGNYGANNYTGAAYLFDGATGALLKTFQEPVPSFGNEFGTSVAAVGNNVLIGSPWAGNPVNDDGAAYLFDATSGSLLQAFQNPHSSASHFGRYVAPSGNDVLVGAPSMVGAAYLFDATSGSLKTTVSAAGNVGNFGFSIGALNNDILVGYSLWNGSRYVGRVGLFDGSTGAWIRDFQNPNPADSPFGGSVASLGNNVLVGKGVSNGGNVYLLDLLTGSPLVTFQEPISNDGFGYALAVVGNNILIGAPHADDDRGAAYLYDSNGLLLETFHPPLPGGNNEFGVSVAGVGNDVLIGSVGTAYLFEGVSAPEPSTLALLFVGGISLLGYRLRRRWRGRLTAS